MFLWVSGWDFPTPTGALILTILAQVGFGFFPSQGNFAGVAASGTGPGRTICGLSAECLVVGFENIAGASAGNALDFVSIRSNDGGRRTAEMMGVGFADVTAIIGICNFLIGIAEFANNAFSTDVALISRDSGVTYVLNEQRMFTFNAEIDSGRG